MREIHDLLNTLGEEQNITARKTALRYVLYSAMKLFTAVVVDSVRHDIVPPRVISTMRANGCLNNKLEKYRFLLSPWDHEGNGG